MQFQWYHKFSLTNNMSDNVNTTTRGISFDKELIKVADELIPNRSQAAQNGLLEEIKRRIETLNEESQKKYRERLGHLLE